MNYGPINIDTSTPAAPVITAQDGRNSNTAQTDSTDLIVPSPIVPAGGSPRTNYFCMVKDPTNTTNPCNPTSTTKPNTNNLSPGIYYFLVKTCTQAGNCGQIRTFILKITSCLSPQPGNSTLTL